MGTVVDYKRVFDIITKEDVVRLSIDRYCDLDMTIEKKIQTILFADVAFCMRNLGHLYERYESESLAFNYVFNKVVFPDVSYSDYLKDSFLLNLAKTTFETIPKTKYVGNGTLKDLNLPKVLERTPYYDLIKDYYVILFRLSKYTTIVDGNIDKAEFAGMYEFSDYVDINNL